MTMIITISSLFIFNYWFDNYSCCPYPLLVLELGLYWFSCQFLLFVGTTSVINGTISCSVYSVSIHSLHVQFSAHTFIVNQCWSHLVIYLTYVLYFYILCKHAPSLHLHQSMQSHQCYETIKIYLSGCTVHGAYLTLAIFPPLGFPAPVLQVAEPFVQFLSQGTSIFGFLPALAWLPFLATASLALICSSTSKSFFQLLVST